MCDRKDRAKSWEPRGHFVQEATFNGLSERGNSHSLIQYLNGTFLAELEAASESEESVHVVDEELPLAAEGILSFCCLSLKAGDLLFFDFFQGR